MEWLLIPITIMGLCVVCAILAHIFFDTTYSNDFLILGTLITIGITLTAMIFSCASYYDGWDEANMWSSYYDNIIFPHIVAEFDDYVVVTSLESGVWQAGDRNLSDYNSYLRSYSEWDDVPFLGLAVYSPPTHLKHVQIQEGGYEFILRRSNDRGTTL